MAEARQKVEWNHTCATYFAVEALTFLLQNVYHDGKGERPEPPELNSIHPFRTDTERQASEAAKEEAARLTREIQQMQLIARRGDQELKKYMEAKQAKNV